MASGGENDRAPRMNITVETAQSVYFTWRPPKVFVPLTPAEKAAERIEYYKAYDPLTGLKIAATLSGLLTMAVLYVFYKVKTCARPHCRQTPAPFAATEIENSVGDFKWNTSDAHYSLRICILESATSKELAESRLIRKHAERKVVLYFLFLPTTTLEVGLWKCRRDRKRKFRESSRHPSGWNREWMKKKRKKERKKDGEK